MNENNINLLSKQDILEKLKYMNNYIATAIRDYFLLEEHSIEMEDIVYINGLYEQKKLKYLTKFFSEIEKNNFSFSLKFSTEQKKFKLFLNKYIYKIVDTKFSMFLWSDANKDFETDNIVDFIFLANNNTYLNENQFNLFRRIINRTIINNSQKEFKKSLSYVKCLHLSHFFKVLDDFVRNIKKIEVIETFHNEEDKNLIGKPKKGVYSETIKNFVYFLNIEQKRYIQGSPFHNTIEKYLDEIVYIGENKINKEVNSHFVQGAYLKRVLSSKINYNGTYIIPSKYNPNNPYTKKLFYGSSLPEDSIEKRFQIVENNFNQYLEQIENNMNPISFDNFFHSESLYNLSPLKKHHEIRIIFILNYIRTPSFIEDLYYSFLVFFKKRDIAFLSLSPTALTNYIMSQLNHLEFRIFFKTVQLAYIETILDFLDKKSTHIEFDLIIQKINNISNYKYRNYLNFEFNLDYLKIVFNKLTNFISNNYQVGGIVFETNTYTDNLFIIKISDDENYELFEDEKQIEIAYFPINKNKFLCFLEVNNCVSIEKKYLSKNKLDEKIMVNKRHIFKIDIIKD